MPWDILKTFAWLGLTAFGGPAAHLAIFQRLLVGEGKWVSKAHYLRVLAVVNLIPGPNSTETAMLLGHARGGAGGLLLAGFGFIFPAALVTLVLVALYQEAASIQLVQGTFQGLKLAVLALIAQALWELLSSAQKQPKIWIFVLVGLVMASLGWAEWAVVLLVGLVSALSKSTKMLVGVELISLFRFFLLVGATLFGSGYALVGLMQQMVARGWLSPSELLNALALGQIRALAYHSHSSGLPSSWPPRSGALNGWYFPSRLCLYLPSSRCPEPSRRTPPSRSLFAGCFWSGFGANCLGLMAFGTGNLGGRVGAVFRAAGISTPAAYASSAASSGSFCAWRSSMEHCSGPVACWPPGAGRSTSVQEKKHNPAYTSIRCPHQISDVKDTRPQAFRITPNATRAEADPAAGSGPG